MHFHFDFDKTLQAAGILLDADDNRMETMRLLKLLYITDRELLAETGRTLTGDRVVAMKNGPVLSRVYDIIRGQTVQSDRWSEFIHRDGYKVILRQKPGREKLSKREVARLLEVTERYRQFGNFELSDETHQFQEWQKHYQEGTSNPIPWEDVLCAQGKPEMIAAAQEEAATREAMTAFFGGETHMNAGDTFLLVNQRLDDHLWVVLSDPKQDSTKVLIVSLTTAASHKESVCLVRAGEHSWVTHETCVAYNYAKIVTLANLHSWKDAGHLKLHDPLSPNLLKRIREQSGESVDLALEYAELLADQGLLDL